MFVIDAGQSEINPSAIYWAKIIYTFVLQTEPTNICYLDGAIPGVVHHYYGDWAIISEYFEEIRANV